MQQALYLQGRGLGLFRGAADLADLQIAAAAELSHLWLNATPDTIEHIIVQLWDGRMW